MTGIGHCLVLVGFRGAGKTTLGRMVADRSSVPFVDTDWVVEELAEASIHEIFTKRGEGAFRELEREVVTTLEPLRPVVIAAGGGTVMDPDCRASLERLGTVIWLEAPASTLAARIDESIRPSLTGRPIAEEVAEVLAARESTYEAMSSHRVSTADRTPEEVCDELQRLWGSPPDHDIR